MRNKKKKHGICPAAKAVRSLKYSVCLPFVFCLWGCSLAVPGAGEEAGDDRMIGVFITREYLDFQHMGQYAETHASAPDKEKREAGYGGPKDERKLYAQIDKSRGNTPEEWEVTFGSLKGIQMFTPLWEPENGESYWGTVCTEGVSDTEIRYEESEGGVEHDISGTVYILPGKTDGSAAFYANPVYQTADGRIYLTSGTGVSKSGESAEGEMLSSAFSGETSTVEDGKERTEKNSVAVKYVLMYRPVRFTILQMDREHRIIKKEDYLPEEVPEELAAEKDTEYILTETEKETPAGEKTVSREVRGRSPDAESYLSAFYARDDGIVVKQEIRVLWNR